MESEFRVHANVLAMGEERRSGDGAEIGTVADEFEIESLLHFLVRTHQLLTRQLDVVCGRLLRDPLLVFLSNIVTDEGFTLVHEGTLVLDTTSDGNDSSLSRVLVPFEDLLVIFNVIRRFLGSSPDSGLSVFTGGESPFKVFEWSLVPVFAEELECLL